MCMAASVNSPHLGTSTIDPNLTRVTNQAFDYYLTPAAGRIYSGALL
jgi:hypothetical protein